MQGFTAPAGFVELNSTSELYDGQTVYAVGQADVSFGRVEKRDAVWPEVGETHYWLFVQADEEISFTVRIGIGVGTKTYYGKPRPWTHNLEDEALYLIAPKSNPLAQYVAIWREYEQEFTIPSVGVYEPSELCSCRPVGQDLLPIS